MSSMADGPRLASGEPPVVRAARSRGDDGLFASDNDRFSGLQDGHRTPSRPALMEHRQFDE